MLASPVRATRSPGPTAIYNGAQQYDEWPGTNYEGSSVRGGAKFLTHEGEITGSYLWATSLNDVKAWIVHHGPVVFGTDWFELMFTPDPKGFCRIGGDVAGGHAYLVRGWSEERHAFRCTNSWSRSWGDDGHFWLSEKAAQVLVFERDGEAAGATEKPL